MPDSSGLLTGTGAKLEHGFLPPFNRVRKSVKQGQKLGAVAVLVCSYPPAGSVPLASANPP